MKHRFSQNQLQLLQLCHHDQAKTTLLRGLMLVVNFIPYQLRSPRGIKVHDGWLYSCYLSMVQGKGWAGSTWFINNVSLERHTASVHTGSSVKTLDLVISSHRETSTCGKIPVSIQFCPYKRKENFKVADVSSPSNISKFKKIYHKFKYSSSYYCYIIILLISFKIIGNTVEN